MNLTIHGLDETQLERGSLRIYEAVAAREYVVDMIGCNGGQPVSRNFLAVSKEVKAKMVLRV